MAMTVKERVDALGEVEIFESCKKRDLRALAKSCEERSFEAGSYLCRQGQRGVAMFVVSSPDL